MSPLADFEFCVGKRRRLASVHHPIQLLTYAQLPLPHLLRRMCRTTLQQFAPPVYKGKGR